jgi:hypothetical protein
LYEEVCLKLLEVKEVCKGEVRFVLIGNSVQDYEERCRVMGVGVPEVFKRMAFGEHVVFDY